MCATKKVAPPARNMELIRSSRSRSFAFESDGVGAENNCTVSRRARRYYMETLAHYWRH